MWAHNLSWTNRLFDYFLDVVSTSSSAVEGSKLVPKSRPGLEDHFYNIPIHATLYYYYYYYFVLERQWVFWDRDFSFIFHRFIKTELGWARHRDMEICRTDRRIIYAFCLCNKVTWGRFCATFIKYPLILSSGKTIEEAESKCMSEH